MSKIRINAPLPVKKEEPFDYLNELFSCFAENLEEYTCVKCSYSTHIKVHLVKHKHNSGKQTEPCLTYNCQKCMNFRTYSLLVYMKHRHQRCPKIKRATKRTIVTCYKCGQCPFQGRRRSFVENHTKKTHSAEDIHCVCIQCGHKTKTANGMKLHMLCTHTPPENIKWFECEHCPYRTKLKHNLQKHEEMKHLEEHGFACAQCDYISKTKWYFAVHLRAKHGTSNNWLQCEHCHFRTKWPGLLRRHSKIKHPSIEAAWFKCEHCGFETQSRDRFKGHRLVHASPDQVEWFECEQCHFRAKYRHNLLRHVRAKHMDPTLVKWVRCDLCDYKSKYNYILKKHVLAKHLGENPGFEDDKWFQCDRCTFKTKRNYLLREHLIAMHTPSEKIQWFECEQCEFKAKLKGGLKRHVRARHGDGVLVQCEFCDFKGSSKKSLRGHVTDKHTQRIAELGFCAI